MNNHVDWNKVFIFIYFYLFSAWSLKKDQSTYQNNVHLLHEVYDAYFRPDLL